MGLLVPISKPRGSRIIAGASGWVPRCVLTADDGLVVDRGGGGGVRGGVHGGEAPGGAVVAAAARGGALRPAGDQGSALPLLHRLRQGDGGAHGGLLRQANAAPLPLPQRPPPRPRLLPPLEENLRYVRPKRHRHLA